MNLSTLIQFCQETQKKKKKKESLTQIGSQTIRFLGNNSEKVIENHGIN